MGMGKACLLLCLSVNLLNHAALECQGVRTVSYAQTIKARVRMISEPWSKTASSPAPNSFQFVFPYLSRVAPRAVRELHNERMLPRQRSSTDESSLALDTPLASDFNPTFDGPGEKDGGGFPPDDAIAAGPNYLVTAINALVGIYDKSGNRIGSLQQMVSFFGSLGLSGSYSDPRVLYDATAGRFIVVDDLVGLPSCFITCTVTGSHILVAISKTGDPTGSWTKYAFDTWGLDPNNAANTWADYPMVGLDSSELYIATDQWDVCDLLNSGSCVFSDAWVSAISLSDLYAGSSSPALTTFKDIKTAADVMVSQVQPAFNASGTPPQEFLAAALYPSDTHATSSSILSLLSIDMSGTPALKEVDLSVPSYSLPPNAPQPGTSVPIATNKDFRLINAVWADGSLWCAHTVADDNGTSAIVRWYKISLTNLSSATLQDSGTIRGSGNAYFPAMMVGPNNQVNVVFGTSSASQYASASYTGRSGGDPPGTMRTPIIYAPGLATYTYSVNDSNGNPIYRWGDYSGIALDQQNRTTWAIVEYSKGPDHNYGNGVVEIASPPSLEAVPDPLQFADELEGQSETLALTLTNAGSDPVVLGTIAVSGQDSSAFSTNTDGCSGTSLPAGSHCSVKLAFSPTTTGTKDAQLEVSQSINGSAQGMIAVHLLGNSISNAKVVFSASALAYSNQAVGTTSTPQSVNLTNSGTGPLTVNSITVTGDFSETNNCSATVSAGGSCNINVVFAPTLVIRLNPAIRDRVKSGHRERQKT